VANPTPSKADITVTQAVAKAAALFDILHLPDHRSRGADLCSKHLKTVLNPAFRQKGPSLVLGLEIPEVAI
jgi:hypothetical protein